MPYLLDTNVVAELRNRKPHGAVQDEAKAQEIERWLDDVSGTYHVLAADAPVFRRRAQLLHGRADHHLEDALIAATVLIRDLTIATRNTDGFKPFGVKAINPFG